MANEFIARNGIIALNNTQITGSLNVSAGITGSLLGTASYATQAINAFTASNITPVITNDGDTRVITANGNGTLNGEGSLTFDGTTLRTTGTISGSTLYSTGNVAAAVNLQSLFSSGDEGGELFLNKPATGTSINTGVNIDVYQNKLRIWEAGGTNRGGYYDITALGASVGTNLLGGSGTVTSVSTAGSVNGITLTGGPITGAGTITLGGTLSGIGNAQLTNSAITIAGSSTSLGGSITQATILNGSGVFSGSAQIANSSIANAQLANSSVTVGSTAISLGSSATTIAGLSSVTSTTFVGALTGNASTATTATTATSATSASTQLTTTDAIFYPTFVDSNNATPVSEKFNTSQRLKFNPSTGHLTMTGSLILSDDNGAVYPSILIGSTSLSSVAPLRLVTADFASEVGMFDGQYRVIAEATSTGYYTYGGDQSGYGVLQISGSNAGIGKRPTGLATDARLQVSGSVHITGSLNVSAGITGSLLGNASTATFAVTASVIKVKDDGSTNAAFPVIFTNSVSVNQELIADINALTYNPSTDTLSVPNLTGTASRALNAEQVGTARQGANATYYPTFVDSNNASATFEKLYTDAGGALTFNPSTGALNATSVTASLQGTASQAATSSFSQQSATASYVNTLNQNVSITGNLTVIGTAGFTGSLQGTATTGSVANQMYITDDPTTNSSYYMVFTPATSGYSTIRVDSANGVSYNPSTNTVTATNFNGTATTASKITIINTDATNATYYPVFVDAQSGGLQARTDVNLTFNSLTNTLAVGASGGSGTFLGTASLATTASYARSASLATTASYATAASQSGYTIQFVIATAPVAPAANTTYRLGAAARNVLTTAAGLTRIYVPRPGRIKYVNVYTRTNGTLASGGTSTFFMSKNSTVSESLGTTTTLGSNANDVFTSTAVSMSVVQGDFLEINLRTPAWGTLPTGLESNAIIYIENNLI